MADLKPWNDKRSLPVLRILGVAVSVGTAFGSLGILLAADGQPVENWYIPPSVYLSILAVLSRSIAEWAFGGAADIYWWGKLFRSRPERPWTLSDVHHTWVFARDKLPLFSVRRPWNSVRVAAISVLLLGAVGPLFQRSLVVEAVTRTSLRQGVQLPLRVEPVWNLTIMATDVDRGTLGVPTYRSEFAAIASNYSQGVPPFLSSGDGTRCEGECTGNVVVAGFARTCAEEYTTPSEDVPYIGPAQYILLWDRDRKVYLGSSYLEKCPTPSEITASDISQARENAEQDPGYKFMLEKCQQFQAYYQVAVEEPIFRDGGYHRFFYRSFVRPDPHLNMLLVQQCNFTTAFLNMTIRIANDSSVTVLTRSGLPQDNVVALIDPPTDLNQNGFLGGFLRVLREAYEGYLFYDPQQKVSVSLGTGPPRYSNFSAFYQDPPKPPDGLNVPDPSSVPDNFNAWPDATNATDLRNQSYLPVSFRSPLDDFTNTLNEISLRYALVELPSDEPARLGNEAFIADNRDLRGNSTRTQSPQTPAFSKTQTVDMEQVKTVIVFRVDYLYATLALAVVALSSSSTAFLMGRYGYAGRILSTDPLELAKAFEAPILDVVPSSAPVEAIVKRLGQVRVRYGELTHRKGRRRLGISKVRQVASPKKGIKYD